MASLSADNWTGIFSFLKSLDDQLNLALTSSIHNTIFRSLNKHIDEDYRDNILSYRLVSESICDKIQSELCISFQKIAIQLHAFNKLYDINKFQGRCHIRANKKHVLYSFSDIAVDDIERNVICAFLYRQVGHFRLARKAKEMSDKTFLYYELYYDMCKIIDHRHVTFDDLITKTTGKIFCACPELKISRPILYREIVYKEGFEKHVFPYLYHNKRINRTQLLQHLFILRISILDFYTMDFFQGKTSFDSNYITSYPIDFKENLDKYENQRVEMLKYVTFKKDIWKVAVYSLSGYPKVLKALLDNNSFLYRDKLLSIAKSYLNRIINNYYYRNNLNINEKRVSECIKVLEDDMK